MKTAISNFAGQCTSGIVEIGHTSPVVHQDRLGNRSEGRSRNDRVAYLFGSEESIVDGGDGGELSYWNVDLYR